MVQLNETVLYRYHTGRLTGKENLAATSGKSILTIGEDVHDSYEGSADYGRLLRRSIAYVFGFVQFILLHNSQGRWYASC